MNKSMQTPKFGDFLLYDGTFVSAPADAKEVKGIYSGDEFPEYKNANTLTIGGKTYIEGLDYEVISSGKHTKIEVCPACKK